MNRTEPIVLSKILTSKMTDRETKQDESILQGKIAAYLDKYFFVFREVWNIGHNFRIDLVIIHRSDIEKKYPIGIEVKLTDKKKGKDLAMWLKQASNYADQQFNVFGKCLIITAPQISDYYLREGERMHQHDEKTGYANNIGTFIGQFNIGELQKYEDKYMRIVFKGQIIWESRYNEFHSNNYERLCPR